MNKKTLSDAMPGTAPEPAPAVDDHPGRPPGRRGKCVISGYFDPAVRQQLKILGAQEGCSTQDLLAESMNLLFRARGLPTIA